jgi:hypothetical protein
VKGEQFSGRWAGTLIVPRDGEYEFEIITDGAITLILNGKPAIEQREGGNTRTLKATLPLTQGDHPLELTGQWQRGDGYLELYWRTPGGERELVPSSALRPASGS